MNVNNIFNLFKQQEQNINPKIKELYINEHPLFFIKMFTKIIDNHDSLKFKVLVLFKKADDNLNIEDIGYAGDYIVFNRAWEFISKINPNNLLHQEVLFDCEKKELLNKLKSILKYFQSQEEYEKCSHIKQIIDFLKLI